jgi:hypothetical protein
MIRGDQARPFAVFGLAKLLRAPQETTYDHAHEGYLLPPFDVVGRHRNGSSLYTGPRVNTTRNESNVAGQVTTTRAILN